MIVFSFSLSRFFCIVAANATSIHLKWYYLKNANTISPRTVCVQLCKIHFAWHQHYMHFVPCTIAKLLSLLYICTTERLKIWNEKQTHCDKKKAKIKWAHLPQHTQRHRDDDNVTQCVICGLCAIFLYIKLL